MYFQTVTLAVLATSALATVSNPHNKAQQFARREVVARSPEPPRLEKRATSPFMNNNTQSKYNGAGVIGYD